MLAYPARLMCTFFLIFGTLMSISSFSWFVAWAGMELNLLAFIPLMSFRSTPLDQAPLKYFLMQAWSSLLLFLIITSFTPCTPNSELILLSLPLPLIMKLGGAPFYFWVPLVCSGLSWVNIFILLTWQKIAPLILVNTLLPYNLLILSASAGSALLGGLLGINQTNLRNLMSFSSINHLGWMLTLSSFSLSALLTYFIVYSLISLVMIMSFNYMNLFSLKQLMSLNLPYPLKFLIFTNLLSLGGLPPFLGFLPKWFSLIEILTQGLYFMALVLSMTSLLSLYYYLRVSIMIFTLTPNSPSWGMKNYTPFSYFMAPVCVIFSLLNFMFYPLLFFLP